MHRRQQGRTITSIPQNVLLLAFAAASLVIAMSSFAVTASRSEDSIPVNQQLYDGIISKCTDERIFLTGMKTQKKTPSIAMTCMDDSEIIVCPDAVLNQNNMMRMTLNDGTHVVSTISKTASDTLQTIQVINQQCVEYWYVILPGIVSSVAPHKASAARLSTDGNDGDNTETEYVHAPPVTIDFSDGLEVSATKNSFDIFSNDSEAGSRQLLRPMTDSNINQRSLQSSRPECRNGPTKTIRLAMMIESSYCARYGGGDASMAIEYLSGTVARVAALYEATTCFTVVLSHVEAHCNPNTDPIRSGVALNRSGCGADGLLQAFAKFWENNRYKTGIVYDLAHLASGTGLECSGRACVIGCAYTATMCRENGLYSYGVNFMAFSNSPATIDALLAHEMGHNAGSYHDEQNPSLSSGILDSKDYIMESFSGLGTDGFSEYSNNLFNEQPKQCLPDYNVNTAIDADIGVGSVDIDFGGGGGGSGCFSGTTTVQVENELQPVQMQHLQIGDRVLTSGLVPSSSHDTEMYEPVYSFGHRSTTAVSNFLQIHYATSISSDVTLEMTIEHLLYVMNEKLDRNVNKKAVRADDVRVGDKLCCGDVEIGNVNNTIANFPNACTVTKIVPVTRTGIYAPLTSSGKIVVNGHHNGDSGVLASTYVGVETMSNIPLVKSLFQQAWLVHLFMSPYRIACTTASTRISAYFGCHTNESGPDGSMNPYVALGQNLFDTFETQNVGIQILMFLGSVCITSMIGLSETMLSILGRIVDSGNASDTTASLISIFLIGACMITNYYYYDKRLQKTSR